MATNKSVPDREALARLLREAGSAYDPAGVAALVAGVLGAPAEVGTRWHSLVADPVTPALADALEALRAQMAAGYRDGLAREDFARLSRAERVALLRQELAARKLDGFVVPRSDEHQGEYVPPRGQRLAWLTGFTGSAGLAVVLRERAALFVDGRYTLAGGAAGRQQLFEIHHLIDEPPARWLGTALKPGEVLGYDPWLHTPHEVERFRAAAEKAGASLRAVDDNPLDRVWPDQPAAPLAPVVPHADAFAGESAQSKRERLARSLAEDGVAAAVLTMPELIAWLLNIRGGDVPHTPLPLSFAILRGDASVALFIDRRKLAPGLERHLGNAVTVLPPDQLGPALDALAAEGARVQADPASAAAWIFDRLNKAGAKIHRAADPCVLPKACKNAAEIDGTRAAHRRDGAALTRFLAWLAREAPNGGLTEIAASDRLEAFRRERRIFPRSELSDDLRGRVEWCDRPLPGDAGNRKAARTRHPLSAQFRRAISRRHDRRDPHRRDRRALGRDARPFYARAERPHRARHGAVSERHDRDPARRVCPPRAVAGRARLRPRHRPRGRQLSRRARGAAAHLQGAERAAFVAWA